MCFRLELILILMNDRVHSETSFYSFLLSLNQMSKAQLKSNTLWSKDEVSATECGSHSIEKNNTVMQPISFALLITAFVYRNNAEMLYYSKLI